MKTPSRSRIVFIVLGAIAVGIVLWTVFGPKKAAPPDRPAVAVTVAQAVYQDVPVAISAIGAVQAWQSDLIRTEVNGKLLKVPVAEGSFVKAGQLLAQIDPAPYQAALMQAQGALARDTALLANAKLDLQRYQTLAKVNSIAGQQVDTQAALVKQDEGVVLIDQGQVAAAQVNVNFTRITSPVTGRVGVRLTDAGNLVSTTDTTGIIVVNQLQPIAVTFTLPQDYLPAIQKAMAAGQAPVLAFTSDDKTELDHGTLLTVDNAIDPTTGTIRLKAIFPNDNYQIWPGQFINIRLLINTSVNALSVPSAAVRHGQNDMFVYIVKPDQSVVRQPVEVERDDGQTAIISKGLDEGQTAVTDGQSRLQNGTRVTIIGGAPKQAANPANEGG